MIKLGTQRGQNDQVCVHDVGVCEYSMLGWR
jgi:hypothetical protein